MYIHKLDCAITARTVSQGQIIASISRFGLEVNGDHCMLNEFYKTINNLARFVAVSTYASSDAI